MDAEHNNDYKNEKKPQWSFLTQNAPGRRKSSFYLHVSKFIVAKAMYPSDYTMLQNKRRKWLGAPPPPTDNFWTVNLTSTNYISLEREFNSV